MSEKKIVKQNPQNAMAAFEPPQSKYKLIRVSQLGSQDIRFIGKDGFGNFTIDGEEFRDLKKIELQIVNIEIIKCDSFYLFNENFIKYEKMAEILFLDGENKMSTLIVKTESLRNLTTLLRKISMNQKNYRTQRVEAVSVERKNDNGKYFALEFKLKGDADEKVTEELQILFEKDQSILFNSSRWLSGQLKKIPRNVEK